MVARGERVSGDWELLSEKETCRLEKALWLLWLVAIIAYVLYCFLFDAGKAFFPANMFFAGLGGK